MLRSRLFVISYAPLFTIAAFRLWPSTVACKWDLLPAVIMLLIATWAILDALWLVKGASKSSVHKISIENVTDEGNNAAAYLVTYIFPFIFTSFGTWQDWTAAAIFLFMLYVISVRSRFGLVNPVFYLLGWRVAQGDVIASADFGGRTKREVFITKDIPSPGLFKVRKMAGGYRIEEK